MTLMEKAWLAIEARRKGEFDNPELLAFGPLTETEPDIVHIGISALHPYGYRFATRAAFNNAADLPPGLLERANPISGAYVVYDPEDDHEGFMLIGDNAADLIRESVAFLIETATC